MEKENIAEILKSLSFRDVDGIWVGSINSNKFMIRKEKLNPKEISLKTSCAIDGSNEPLFKFLDEKKNENNLKSFSIEENLLILTYILSDDGSDFEVFLKELSKVLSELKAKDVCFLCNKVKETEAYKFKDIPTFMCSECFENTKLNIEKAKNEPNNYLTGFLGCILGALVGSLLWILIGYFNFYASIAGYFIAYCAFYGYNFGKGKATKVAAVINILAIVFAMLFAEYIGLFIGVRKEFGIDFISFLKLFPTLFSNLEFVKSLIPSLGFGFLFAGLGSYRIIMSIFKTAKKLSNDSVERIL